MSKKISIPLDEPIVGHGGMINTLVYREPRYRDIMGHGKPYSVHRAPDGSPMIINDEVALAHYAEVCLVEPIEHDLILKLCLTDTMKVREMILDFFLQPAAAGAGSKTSPATSGFAQASPPTPSAG